MRPLYYLISAKRAYFKNLVAFVLLLLLLPSSPTSAQSGVFVSREANIWYFGNMAGLDFSTGSPLALSNSSMVQHEGSAVASDPVTGELLFYTNGTEVWNSQHEIMAGGTDLLGHRTSTQTALIVRDPGNRSRHYIFTVGAGTYVDDNNNGFRYSVVDMQQDGGLGGVILANQPVLDSTAEKLAATRHCNGRDYWILVHDYGVPGNRFYAYLLTPEGLQSPIVSQIGIPYETGHDLQGCFKFSPDGEQLAVSSAGPKALELYRFDRIRGTVYDSLTIDTGQNFYGIEFSVSGSKLYTALLPPANVTASLSQYDLTQNSAEAIRDSRVFLHLESGNWQGAQVQMGPDGRIYVSFFGKPYLGVINSPENSGLLADFIPDGVDLGAGSTEYGLPNFVQSNLFFGSSGGESDSLVNFPCSIPEEEEEEPECPEKDSLFLEIGNHRGTAEGDRVVVPVRISRGARFRSISEISITISFNPTMFVLEEPSTSSSTSDALLEGWELEQYSVQKGVAQLRFRSPVPVLLSDTGVLLQLSFRSYLGFTSELFTLFELQAGFGADSCIVAVPTPGRADIDLCGEAFRLMELAGARYSLGSIQWVPDQNALTVQITTGISAPTLIELFDVAGNRIAALDHPFLPAGSHNASIDGSSLESGSYLVRVVSGPWQVVERIVLRR